jgi:ferredoxin
VAHTVVIDKAICQSSGNCVNDAPDAFGFDEDDLGDVLPGAADIEPQRLIAIAARCPAIAISIFDPSGREIGKDR